MNFLQGENLKCNISYRISCFKKCEVYCSVAGFEGSRNGKRPDCFLISEDSEKGKYHLSDNNGRNRDIFYEL